MVQHCVIVWKKVDVASARHPVSQLVKHHVLWQIKAVKRSKVYFSIVLFLSKVFNKLFERNYIFYIFLKKHIGSFLNFEKNKNLKVKMKKLLCKMVAENLVIASSKNLFCIFYRSK